MTLKNKIVLGVGLAALIALVAGGSWMNSRDLQGRLDVLEQEDEEFINPISLVLNGDLRDLETGAEVRFSLDDGRGGLPMVDLPVGSRLCLDDTVIHREQDVSSAISENCPRTVLTVTDRGEAGDFVGEVDYSSKRRVRDNAAVYYRLP